MNSGRIYQLRGLWWRAQAQSRKSFSPSIQASNSDGTSSGAQLRAAELRRKARDLHLESFHFTDDGVFLELKPEPHLDECEATERERRRGSPAQHVSELLRLYKAPRREARDDSSS